MKDIYFLKHTHINTTAIFILIYLLLTFIMTLFVYRHLEAIFSIGLIFILVTCLTIFFIKSFNKCGLYIVGNKLYYKRLICQQINPSDIVGIKIIHSMACGGRIRGFYDIKDSKGNSLYSAIFLKGIDADMKTYNRGDIMFNGRFKKYIMFSVVYDEKVIKKICNINPNITIIR